jgi:hypothetical protein
MSACLGIGFFCGKNAKNRPPGVRGLFLIQVPGCNVLYLGTKLL